MAHLVRQQIVRHTDPATGKRVPKGTPGARVTREKSKKWYGVGVPGYPPTKRIPLATDKAASKRMLDDLIRQAERGRAGIPDQDAGQVRLTEQLEAFRKAVSIGMAARRQGRAAKVPSAAQVTLLVQRVRDLIAGCGFVFPADLGDPAPEKLAGYLQGRVRLPRKDGGISHQTAAFYLTAARRFVWWLSTRKRLPVRADLFDAVPGFEPANNRLHPRRALTPEEMARVLEAALAGTSFRELSGEGRYFLYLVAFSTGFRVQELAALTPGSFDLDGGTVRLGGKRTKNKKGALIPLNPGVVAQLRGFVAGKPADAPLWPSGEWGWVKKAAMMLRRDLAAAGVPYQIDGPNGPEFADFHALRHSFVSALAAAGVGPKELQELARHSDPRLTLGLYTHTRPEQLVAAVGRLSLPTGDAPADPLAAMPRKDLETLAAGLIGLLAVVGHAFAAAPARSLVTLPVTPENGTVADQGGR